jgi:thiamine transport system substrate-binding protein
LVVTPDQGSPRLVSRILWKRLLGFGIALLVISLGTWILLGRPSAPADAHDSVRVMTYSSFMNSWGPGPEIAKRFREETGLTVEFQDAGDAGLILEKLKLFPVDAVVGLDGLSLADAKARHKWREVPVLPNEPGSQWRDPSFLAVDYAPVTFIYREGEIEPPKTLEDLLDPRFDGKIALEDPRTSTPGLQFVFWILDAMGEEKGFQFLSSLKANLHSVSPSWSSAYGSFTKKQSSLVFSYQTSPLYHLIEEKDSSYRAVIFDSGHPLQIEYAAVPEACERCADGEAFVHFLQKKEIQAVIMKKNFMMPVDPSAKAGTPFESLAEVKVSKLESAPVLMKKRGELFERWRALGL